jgi:hypothetical protein
MQSNSTHLCTSIHLGTFNVNGKVPSQDLSPWVLHRPHSQTPQPVEDIPGAQEKDQMQASGSSSPSQPLSPLRTIFQHGATDVSYLYDPSLTLEK